MASPLTPRPKGMREGMSGHNKKLLAKGSSCNLSRRYLRISSIGFRDEKVLKVITD